MRKVERNISRGVEAPQDCPVSSRTRRYDNTNHRKKMKELASEQGSEGKRDEGEGGEGKGGK